MKDCCSRPWKSCWQKPRWQICAHGPHGYAGVGAQVAPPRRHSYFVGGAFLVVQPVHLHQHARAACARQSANVVPANMISILPSFAFRFGRSPSPVSVFCRFVVFALCLLFCVSCFPFCRFSQTVARYIYIYVTSVAWLTL